MELLVHLLLFAFWSGALLKASEYFLDTAERIGTWLGFSPVLIGIILLGFGTSLPELVTSILAASKGAGEAVLGNVIGSNVTNVLLVLGAAALASKRFVVPLEVTQRDVGILLASGILLFFSAQDGVITLPEALFLLLSFVFFVDIERRAHRGTKRERPSPVTFLLFIASMAFIYLAADSVVAELIALSSFLGLPVFAVSAILLSLSTSLPELVVSVTSALKGKTPLSMGNVIGSNVFNSLVVTSVPAFFGNVRAPDVAFPLTFMFFSIFLLFLFSLDRKISKQEAAILLLLYVFFVAKNTGVF